MSAPGLPFDHVAPVRQGRKLGSPTLNGRQARGQRSAAAAAQHADKVIARWLQRAQAMVAMFAASQAEPWLLEDARAYATARGLEAPPDMRAWGGVAQLLKRKGVIVPTGAYLAAKSSNGAPKALWTAGGRQRPGSPQ